MSSIWYIKARSHPLVAATRYTVPGTDEILVDTVVREDGSPVVLIETAGNPEFSICVNNASVWDPRTDPEMITNPADLEFLPHGSLLVKEDHPFLLVRPGEHDVSMLRSLDFDAYPPVEQCLPARLLFRPGDSQLRRALPEGTLP
ncbi:hypothetical protein ASF98_21260 [Arthrobacter sp. Leaf337]|uniref:hypothetical protein n=1 Tax=Arthrobacter sp. Leaf337 TaxID=1736342 RepID=UPI0006FFFE6B|nr:hypothetical protein [Arthrobacter sp. Leaf337]KQR77279.1 hypothetical protein ASF98_21260 [Arthrobacter sp. Leaf337]